MGAARDDDMSPWMWFAGGSVVGAAFLWSFLVLIGAVRFS